MKNAKGVTLMELVVVITIIGISAAVAIPNMGPWLAKQKLNTTARTMATHLNLARSRAIQGNENVSVIFSTASNGYRVTSASAGTIVPQTTLPSNISITDVSLSSGDSTTGFTSQGIALSSGSIKIRSSRLPSNQNSRTLNITVGGGVTITP